MAPAELAERARHVRRQVLETALTGGKGHIPPALSWVEIGVALYCGGALRHRPDDPNWSQRDRFLLSKGHGCLTLYALLADRGFFPEEELQTFVQDGSRLAGHPDPEIPGVEMISGSLGHGLGFGAGLALGARHDSEAWRVFTLLGDGECQEGSVWEAAAFAGQHGLSNLIAIVDRNRLCSTDFTENVIGLEPAPDRWQSVGWDVLEVDGHDLTALVDTFGRLDARMSDRPLVLIAHTTKGRGVSFMENSPQWHHRMPKGDEIDRARAELGGAS